MLGNFACFFFRLLFCFENKFSGMQSNSLDQDQGRRFVRVRHRNRWRSSIVFGLSVRLSVRCRGDFQISYMDVFHLNPVQVWIRVLSDEREPRWPTKCPLPISVHCRGHSNLVIFNRISSKIHISVAPIKLSFMFEYEFCPTNDN